MRRPIMNNKCQLASVAVLVYLSVLIVSSIQQASCKPQQQQQQFDKHRDRKQQQQVDDQANHLSRTSVSPLSSTTATATTTTASESQQQQQQASSSPGGPFQCPEQFGYYVDPRDCSKYYVCVFGEVLHESCTGGLRFSRELQTCDWPRNVQCAPSPSSSSPPSPSSTLSSATSAANGPTSSTTPLTTATATSTTTVSSVSSSTSASSPAALSQSQREQPPNNGRSQQQLKNSATMVFADEGSDPQQPSFDEAVSPVITPDGAIHLHDGSGGTFSLQAQPNQHHHQQQPNQQQQAAGLVDVFVKPLLASGQQQHQPANQMASRQRHQSAPNQQQIKPATGDGGGAALSQSQNHQHQSRNNQFNPSSASPAPTSTSPASNEDNQPITNMNEDDLDDNSDGPSSSVGSTSGSETASSGVGAGGDDGESSLGAQADQELANLEQPTGGLESTSADQILNSSASDQSDLPSSLSAATAAGQHQRQQSGAYIPPVMAPQATSVARQAANSRQSGSQLLSVNNRQIDSRNSFRPILVSSSAGNSAAQPVARDSSGRSVFNAAAEDGGAGGSSELDEVNGGGGDSPNESNNSDQPANSVLLDEMTDSNNRPLLASSDSGNIRSSGSGAVQGAAVAAQQQARFRQQPNNLNGNNLNGNDQQQSLMRHNQSTFTTGPNFKNNNLNNLNLNLNQLNQNNNNNNNLPLAQQQQNNRQSRMSMQSQQQSTNNKMNNNNFQVNFQPTNRFLQQHQPSGLNGNNQNHHQHHQHVNNNNNNFMNESKLIRLQQASQFEPLPPVDLPTPPSTTIAPLNSNSNNFHIHPKQQQQQFSSSQSLQQLAPSQRSQNVLFSQRPFGLIADSNGGGQANNQPQQPQRAPATFQFAEPPQPVLNLQQQQQQASSSTLLQQQQQQRRPRPPKRQQIPAGQPAGSTVGGRRQQQQQQPQLTDTTLRNQLFPEPEDAPPPPKLGTTSGSTMSTFQPAISSSGVPPASQPFLFASEMTDTPSDPSTDSVSEEDADLAPSPTPFLPPATSQRFQPSPPGSSFGAPLVTTEMAPTVATGGSATTNRTRDRDSGVGRDQQQQQQVGQRNSQGQQQQQPARPRQAKLFSAPQSSTDGLLAGQKRQPALVQPTLLQANSNPSLPLNPGLATTAATTATTAAATSNSAGNTNQQEQDPQLVANRYLNSAMEAGQPFGAVDYDFEILNDNSTDRRNPSASPPADANSGSNVSTDRQRANSNSANQRQRGQQQQPAFNGGGSQTATGEPNPATTTESSSSANDGSDDGDSFASTSVGGGGRQRGGSSRGAVSSTPASVPAAGTTKKPRPTNKKIQVNHEQALANNRASMEPARRPENLYSTPTPLQTAQKCDTRQCRLPDCKCGDTLIPGALEAKQIPQVVLLTFDDAVNDLNWEIYEELFTGRTNPNGCPLLATFYVSHEWTDYGQVQTLYSRGHEMASHSITHSFGEKFSKHQWFKEVNGQREILNLYGGVKMQDVRGMRAPFLQIGGNKMFEMLYDANFTYDSSMPIFENSPPLWPYTLDYQLAHECMITPCPTKSFPGVWEVGMTMWVDLRGGRCSMGDACSNPSDEDGVYEMLMKNFNRHYKSNRAPFGLFYHSAWFNTVHHRRGFLRFLAQVNSLPDVFFTTNWQMLQWMRQPTPLSEINSFEPWQCPAKNDRPPPCYHPSVCNVKSEHGEYQQLAAFVRGVAAKGIARGRAATGSSLCWQWKD